MTLDNMTGITEGSYTGFCKSQLITCNFVKACNGVCPFEDALKHADKADIEFVTQTMNEQTVIDHDRDWIIGCIQHDGFIHTHRFDKANQIILEALSAEQGWIPFTRRPMTEEEQKDYPNCTFMFDCVLPDDGDEILVSNRRFVWMDVFCSDIDGCYLDSGDDIDEDMAWMPLPNPYKGGKDDNA